MPGNAGLCADGLKLDERAALNAHPITEAPEGHVKGPLHDTHEGADDRRELRATRASWRDDDRHEQRSLRCVKFRVSLDGLVEGRRRRSAKSLIDECTHHITSDGDNACAIDRTELPDWVEHRRIERAPVGEVVVLRARDGDVPRGPRERQSLLPSFLRWQKSSHGA